MSTEYVYVTAEDLYSEQKELADNLKEGVVMCLGTLEEAREALKEACRYRDHYEKGLREIKLYAASSKFSGPLENQLIHSGDIIRRVDEILNPYFMED